MILIEDDSLSLQLWGTLLTKTVQREEKLVISQVDPSTSLLGQSNSPVQQGIPPCITAVIEQRHNDWTPAKLEATWLLSQWYGQSRMFDIGFSHSRYPVDMLLASHLESKVCARSCWQRKKTHGSSSGSGPKGIFLID